MADFVCANCGHPLTPTLTPLGVPLTRPRFEGRGPGPSTVPRGYYAVDTEPFGAPLVPAPDPDDVPMAMPGGVYIPDPDGPGFLMSAGPVDTIVIHPDDAPTLECHPDRARFRSSCCGPTGKYGNNRVCPCGQEVATLSAECYGAHELHLDPRYVRQNAGETAYSTVTDSPSDPVPGPSPVTPGSQ